MVTHRRINVTMRPKAQYHSMCFGAPAATPASMVPKSITGERAARPIVMVVVVPGTLDRGGRPGQAPSGYARPREGER